MEVGVGGQNGTHAPPVVPGVCRVGTETVITLAHCTGASIVPARPENARIYRIDRSSSSHATTMRVQVSLKNSIFKKKKKKKNLFNKEIKYKALNSEQLKSIFSPIQYHLSSGSHCQKTMTLCDYHERKKPWIY